MNMRQLLTLPIAALLAAVWLPVLAQSQEEEDLAEADDARELDVAPPASGPWPSQFTHANQSFTVYPPQLDRWQGERIEARAAVAVQGQGDGKPAYGTVWLSARTQTDASGVVTVRDISVSRADFPTAGVRTAQYLNAIRDQLAAMVWQVPVERLRGDLAIDAASQQAQSQPLRNDPPRIVYRQSPSVLVPIDGQPVLREVSGLDLMRVVNTRALLLSDRSTGRYFLFVNDRWLDAPSIDGPWTEAHVRPSELDEAKEQAVASGQVDLLDDDESIDTGAATVIVTTQPAELVQTDGAPQYAPIDGTRLLYVTNTPNRLFLDLATQQHYVLLAGRWYRTGVLSDRGWDFVPGGKLPADFARIPDSHPTQMVREAVAGTPQAQEAAIANSVPQVATVRRTSAHLEIGYDGPAQFSPIEGTSLEYAVNAPLPVIRVDGNNYYALDNGIWFFASSAEGSWSAAASVPYVIYTIPRSSPLHYVTYVRIYDANQDTVSVGYTPGYVGSYLTTDSTVVYGTGWYYRPWIGHVWYAPPVTWGFGFTYWNTWWNPWPWRHHHHHHHVRLWRPAPAFHPWWGPWRAHRFAHKPVVVGGPRPIVQPLTGGHVISGTAGINRGSANVANIYRRWGPRVAEARGPRPAITDQSLGTRREAGARPSGPNGQPDWSVWRQRDGQWQRFMGNGRWQRSPNPPSGATAAVPSGGAAIARPGPAVVTPQPGTPAVNMPQARPAPMPGTTIVGPHPRSLPRGRTPIPAATPAPSAPVVVPQPASPGANIPAARPMPMPSVPSTAAPAAAPVVRIPRRNANDSGRIAEPTQRAIVSPTPNGAIGAPPRVMPPTTGQDGSRPNNMPPRSAPGRVPLPSVQPVVPGSPLLDRRSMAPPARQAGAPVSTMPRPAAAGVQQNRWGDNRGHHRHHGGGRQHHDAASVRR